MRMCLVAVLAMLAGSAIAEEVKKPDVSINSTDDGNEITIVIKVKKETIQNDYQKAYEKIKATVYQLVGIQIETEVEKPKVELHESKGEAVYHKAIPGSITPDGFVVNEEGCTSCKKVYHWESDPDNESNFKSSKGH